MAIHGVLEEEADPAEIMAHVPPLLVLLSTLQKTLRSRFFVRGGVGHSGIEFSAVRELRGGQASAR